MLSMHKYRGKGPQTPQKGLKSQPRASYFFRPFGLSQGLKASVLTCSVFSAQRGLQLPLVGTDCLPPPKRNCELRKALSVGAWGGEDQILDTQFPA